MFYREEEQLRQSLEDTTLKPGTITEACKSVRKIVDHHSVGLQFLSEACCLIDRIFLSNGELPAWLSVVSKPGYEHDATSLLSILQPQGCFLSLLSRMNDHRCFVYPIDRLPMLTKRMLSFSNRRELMSTWPQYHGNVFGEDEPAVEFPVLVYYLVSFVKYATVSGKRRHKESPNILSILSSFAPKASKAMEPIYVSLLQSYLEHFMPRDRHRIDHRGGEASRAGRPSISEIFLGIMEEFWLTDFLEPVPKGLSLKSAGSTIRSKIDKEYKNMIRPSSRQKSPPSNLVDSLILLFEYVDQDFGVDGIPRPALDKIRWLPHVQMHTHPVPKGLFLERPFVDTDVGSLAAQALFRRLFRYIWRTLDGWDERSDRSLSAIVDLWMLHACPWKESKRRSKAKPSRRADASPQRIASNTEAMDGEFSERWLPHVLANFPFYNVLLPMILRLTSFRLPYRPDSAIRDLMIILEKFKNPDFRDVLVGLENSLTDYVRSGQRAVEGPHSHLIPFLSAQMQDWTTSAKSGISTQGLGVLQADFSVFSAGNDRVCNLLQSIMVEADGLAKQKYCAALQALSQEIFDVKMPFRSSETSSGGSQTTKPMKWNDLNLCNSSPHYDPMHQIPTSYEISFLAEKAVSLSDTINRKLRLPGKPFYASDVRLEEEREDVDEEGDLPLGIPRWLEDEPGQGRAIGSARKFLRLLVAAMVIVCHWFWSGFNEVLLPYIRRKHPNFRVNLRFVADRVILSAICLGLFLLSSKEFSILWLGFVSGLIFFITKVV
ncbi:hypothetical protein BSKO_04025 [Bryopsis sp. KO-2023]|nr:hypothetical protein BSKO_04025 [Bryopsis sp. KO-2023]